MLYEMSILCAFPVYDLTLLIALAWLAKVCTATNDHRIQPGNPLMKKYRCMVCSHVYDPAEGDPDSGIAPGTAFENLPETWSCPDCGATKADFEPMD